MLHSWMYRFSFPGFAETEWVLPEGVEHDEAWYEPLPWNMACQDLGAWSLDPALEDKLRELHLATFGEPLTEPVGVPFHALMEPLRGAFERGELVAWVLRVYTVQHPAQLPSSKPKPRPQEQKKTWIEIVLVDQNGIQVPNEPYRLTPVDGEPRKGELDERGFARVEGIVPGPCDVTFPRIDGREWSESGPSLEGDLREDGAPVTHVVREGECMSSIAAKNRFRSWRTLFDSPLNEVLRRSVRDPNVLTPGTDRVAIDRFIRVEPRPPERRHVFKVVKAPTLLRLRIERVRAKRYTLEVAGRSTTRPFPSSALIEHEIPATATTARLVLHLADGDGPTIAWSLELGRIVPVAGLRGVRQRLENLGYAPGPREADPSAPNLHQAVARYQRSVEQPASGVLDDTLREEIRSAHDEAG